MANTNDASPGKSMDIAKPGKSTPDTTSRPVIVTHQTMVQDPMVKTDEVKSTEVQSPTHNKSIQPLTDAEKNKDSDGKDKDSSKTKEDNPKTSEQKAADKEAAVVDAVAEQSAIGKSKSNNGEPTPEEIKQKEHLASLVESKKYFVNIGQVARRRNKRFLIVFIILIIISVALYASVDSGLLDVGVDVPIDLIKN